MSNSSIVFINQATGYLTIDIVNAFARSGKFNNVALIAGSIRVQDLPLATSVQVSSIVQYSRGNPVWKFLSWFWGTIQIGGLLMTKYRKYEIVYISIPPFAYLLSTFLRNRFSILVFDVYPDALRIYGISERNVLARTWSWLNSKVFKRAYRIFTIGAGMANVLAKYMPHDRIVIIPNWSGLTQVKRVDRKDNKFIINQGLQDKFIIQYSGNIGYTHNVEVLVSLAEQLQDEPQIFFLIIGRGERYRVMHELIVKKKLTNCRLLPFQPDDQLNETLSAADLAVVLLDEKTAHVSIPSKLYNLQAVGAPVLGICHPESELAHHVTQHNIGRCFSAAEPDSIIKFIREARANPGLLNQWQQQAKATSALYTMKNAEHYLNEYVRNSR